MNKNLPPLVWKICACGCKRQWRAMKASPSIFYSYTECPDEYQKKKLRRLNFQRLKRSKR